MYARSAGEASRARPGPSIRSSHLRETRNCHRPG
jgi:hypothetical protein